MTKRKSGLGTFLACALLGCGSIGAMAQNASVSQDDDPADQRIERAARGLNLTDTQRTQMQTLVDEHRAATQGLREQVRSARQTLATTKPGDPNYDSVTAEARGNLEAARSQLRSRQQQFRDNVQGLLTPDQRAQLESRQAERRARPEGDRRTGERPRESKRPKRGGG